MSAAIASPQTHVSQLDIYNVPVNITYGCALFYWLDTPQAAVAL